MAITAPPEPAYFESGHTDQVSGASSNDIYGYEHFLSMNGMRGRIILQVHDIQFDYYGRRVATCSSDRTIKVIQARRTSV